MMIGLLYNEAQQDAKVAQTTLTYTNKEQPQTVTTVNLLTVEHIQLHVLHTKILEKSTTPTPSSHTS